MPLNKRKIAANFSAAADGYDQYAVMQKQAARSLVKRLTDLCPQIPQGPILEVGCGTGAVSMELIDIFPGRNLTLVDFAPGMINRNRQSLAPYLAEGHDIDWQVRDAETINIRSHYALITSCLTMQWFDDLTGCLTRFCRALVPGGFLLCSYLGDDSFPEWRKACLDLNLPCTMNPLPNSHQVLKMIRSLGREVSAWDETITLPYPTVQDFFRSLKKTGTNTRSSVAGLTHSQMARLLESWPGKNNEDTIQITYQINTFMVRS